MGQEILSHTVSEKYKVYNLLQFENRIKRDLKISRKRTI